jgi:multidrug efflux system membrane fusion protein
MSGRARFLIILLAASTASLLVSCDKHQAQKAPRPPDVTLANPVRQEVTRYLEYTGTTAALQSVDIRARVPGFLTKMCFQPRAKVKAGDLLFVIDPRHYEANVKEAKGKLDAQKAQSKLAQTELLIAQQLESKEAISALRLEKKAAERDVAGANVELANADLDKAKLDLEWTQVTSPINGRVSRNLVDVGNLVGATEKTLLTTVQDDESVYAYFNVSELDLLPLLRKFAKEKGHPEKPAGKVPVYMGLADETGYPHKGYFDFADTKVDSSTGTIQVRAIFPNPDGLLMAGLFVRVRVPVDKHQAVLIPDVAIQFDQGGKYVLAVDDENIVQRKAVKTGEKVGQMRVIEEGITPKDRVLAGGWQRARPGSKVHPLASQTDALKANDEARQKSEDK